MPIDEEGFVYPDINIENCTKCGLCKEICPIYINNATQEPMKVYAAKNKDESIRKLSSSGGMFTLIAEKIITDGGVVFGAKFNSKWEVTHDYTETKEGLAGFRGSKYVQSLIGDSYLKVKDFLMKDRTVLFSGTPCQIAGLKMFLGKEYENLLTVDIICHGVSSPIVWKKYLSELLKKYPQIFKSTVSDINFRDKTHGWKIFSFAVGIFPLKKKVFIESLRKNIYMKGFLNNLYLRLSCYNCKSKPLKSGSDITLGDYWGIQNVLPELDDNKGISLVMVNTEKGSIMYNRLDKDDKETSYADCLEGNGFIEKSAVISEERGIFFGRWNNEPLMPLIRELTHRALLIRIKNRINYLLYLRKQSSF
jgi:coenzyme F420-reducing hydrogenase beta subunit